MSKQSKGPFKVVQQFPSLVRYEIHSSDGEDIAVIKTRTPAQAESDAYLLAASSELLDACKAAREWLGASTNDDEERLGRALDNAIFKANPSSSDSSPSARRRK